MASLSHPGSNVTGAAIDAAWGLWLRRLQLFHEMVPKAMRSGYLIRRANWDVLEAQGRPGDEFARKLGLTYVGPPLNHPINEAKYRRVFASLARGGADGIVVDDEAENLVNLNVIVELAEKNRLRRSTYLPCLSKPAGSRPMGSTRRNSATAPPP